MGSRKSASCALGLTERRTLAAPPGRASPKGALWRFWSAQNASFRDVKLQNALFRKMRFSSPAQTRRRLTEKRTLWLRRDGKAQSGPCPQSTPHGKAHSARWVSRKGALWPRPGGASHQKTHSGWGVTSRMRLYVSLHRRNARRRLGPAMQRETSAREVRRRRGPGRRPGPRDAIRRRPRARALRRP